MVIKNYKFVTIIFSLLLFTGCEKDPIFGLERGWIWDGIEGSDSNSSGNSKMQFEVNDDGNVKVFEGITTAGLPVLDRNVQDGDIFLETFKKQKYTIKWTDSRGDVESESFTLKKCTTISLNSWGLSIYKGVCD